MCVGFFEKFLFFWERTNVLDIGHFVLISGEYYVNMLLRYFVWVWCSTAARINVGASKFGFKE